MAKFVLASLAFITSNATNVRVLRDGIQYSRLCMVGEVCLRRLAHLGYGTHTRHMVLSMVLSDISKDISSHTLHTTKTMISLFRGMRCSSSKFCSHLATSELSTVWARSGEPPNLPNLQLRSIGSCSTVLPCTTTNAKGETSKKITAAGGGGGGPVQISKMGARKASLNPAGNPSENLQMTRRLGTPAWTAPELNAAKVYGTKVDAFSFGVVLWEMAHRMVPFGYMTSRFDIEDAIARGDRPAISDSVPLEFKTLMTKCWQTNPNDRPTFKDIVKELDALLSEEAPAAIPQVRTASVAYRDGLPRTRTTSRAMPIGFNLSREKHFINPADVPDLYKSATSDDPSLNPTLRSLNPYPDLTRDSEADSLLRGSESASSGAGRSSMSSVGRRDVHSTGKISTPLLMSEELNATHERDSLSKQQSQRMREQTISDSKL